MKWIKNKDPFNVLLGFIMILMGVTVLLVIVLACIGNIRFVDEGAIVPLSTVRWTLIPWAPFFILVVYFGIMVVNDDY